MKIQNEIDMAKTRREQLCLRIWILFCLFIGVLLFGLEASAESGSALALEKAVLKLIEKAPRHRLNDQSKRIAFANAVLKVSNASAVPPSLTLAVSYLESSMNTTSIGYAREEIGLMQVHGLAAKGCDLNTEIGQLECGVKWLERCKQTCKTWNGALTAYATGNCTTSNPLIQRKIRYRLKFWKKIKLMMK